MFDQNDELGSFGYFSAAFPTAGNAAEKTAIFHTYQVKGAKIDAIESQAVAYLKYIDRIMTLPNIHSATFPYCPQQCKLILKVKCAKRAEQLSVERVYFLKYLFLLL